MTVVFASLACSHGRDPDAAASGSHGDEMSEQQIIARAREFAQDQGQTVERYEVTAELDDGTWYVNFTPKAGETPAPGDFFTVVIDDDGKAPPRLVPGK